MSRSPSGSEATFEAEISTSSLRLAERAPVEDQLPGGAKRLFRAGDKVSGRYRIQRFIARGGMGEVYAALDTELGQTVALKAVRPEVALHSQTLRRFRREINLSRKITHHNVCRIYDVGSHFDERHDLSIRYLTMELLEGLTLTRHLRRHGPMSTEEALPLVVQIASGLGAAHEAGVVHRDFKTSNVLLAETPRGVRAVLTDFGLSQSLGEDGLTPIDSDKLTGTGQLMGTLAYLAPEQLEGKQCSAATDIYSLGVVLYQLITGKLPFDGGSPLMAALKRLHEDPPDPGQFVADLDPVWRDMLLRCLHRDPEQRFGNTAELLEALGVELANDSSTGVLRSQLLERLSAEQKAAARPESEVAAGSGAQTTHAGRTLPMWKAVVLAVAVGLAVLGITQLAPRFAEPDAGQDLAGQGAAGQDEIEVLLAAAAEQRAAGHLEQAAEKLHTACQLRPSPSCSHDLVEVLLQAGRAEAAREELDRMLERWPDDPFGQEKLAVWELLYGDLAQALEQFRRQAASGEARPGVLGGMALAHMLNGDYEQAAQLFELLRERYPENTDSLLNHADALQAAGREDQAVASYARVLSLLEPKQEKTWVDHSSIAQARAHLGDEHGARMAVERSLEMAPDDDYLPHLWASLVYALTGDREAARREAAAARSLGARERWFDLPWLQPLRDPGNAY